MKKVRITIGGMHCDHCVESIRAAVAALPGVSAAAVAVGDASIELDEAVTEKSAIVAAIHAAGPFEVLAFSATQ